MVFGLCQCNETVRINADGQESNISTPPIVETPLAKNARVIFTIQADFPEGAIRPDVVYMDGKILEENSTISTGSHSFVVEKKGYHQKTGTMMVTSDKEGMYNLQMKLDSKDRIVLFDIRDAVTNSVLLPDIVSIVDTDEGEKKQNIVDRSYVKPGRKKLVIQKVGYTPISADINIKPDEEPYAIQYKLTPEKK